MNSSDDSSDEEFIEEKDEESDVDLGPEFEPPPSPTNPLIVDLEDGVSRKERRAQVSTKNSLSDMLNNISSNYYCKDLQV